MRADMVDQRAVEWLWPGRIARGKLTLLGGDPGVGKSQLAIDAIARITSGGAKWPDGGTAPSGSCIILSAEDAAADTLCPRLEAAGADLARIHIFQSVVERDGRKRSFRLQSDLSGLELAAENIGDVAMIMVDPITAYMGDVNSHRTTDVRNILEPFDKFAEKNRIAIVAITHPPKAATAKAINSFTGSLAFVAASRLAFIAIEEPESDRALFLAVKNNLGPKASGLGYRIEPVATSKGIATSRVAWDDRPVTATASAAMAAANDNAHRGRSKGESLRDAEKFLLHHLKEHPLSAGAVKEAAAAHGIADRTIRRAKKSLGVIVAKAGYQGEWMWSLPTKVTN